MYEEPEAVGQMAISTFDMTNEKMNEEKTTEKCN